MKLKLEKSYSEHQYFEISRFDKKAMSLITLESLSLADTEVLSKTT